MDSSELESDKFYPESLTRHFDQLAEAHVRNGAAANIRIQTFKQGDGFAVNRGAQRPGPAQNAERRDVLLGEFLNQYVSVTERVAVPGTLYVPVTEANIGSKKMKPLEIEKVRDGYPLMFDKLLWRISDEIPINARLRTTNLVISVVRGLGSYVSLNPFVKRLAWWVNTEHNGQNPVREERSSVMPIKDSVATTRLQMLINASMIWHVHDMEKRPAMTKLWIDVFDWMFLDPLTRLGMYKTWITVLQQTAFVLSTSGKFTHYGPVRAGMRHYNKSAIQVLNMTPDMANHGYWSLVKETFEEMSSEMTAEGLTFVRNWFTLMLSQPFSIGRMRDLHVMSALVGITGFTGTDGEQTFIDNYDVDRPQQERPMNYYLSSEFKKIWTKAKDTGKLPSEKQFAAAAPMILTSKSAGVEGVRFTVNTAERLGRKGVKEVPLAGKSKALVGMAKPQLMHITQLRGYTEEEPGTLGKRTVVGGKDARSIFALRISNFVWEWYLQETMFRIMSERQTDRDDPVGNNSYAFNHATGIADHSIEIIASADPLSLGVFADYAEFDKSFFQRKREILIKAYREWCDEALESGKAFGTVKLGYINDVKDYLDVLWGGSKREGAVFKYKYYGEDKMLQVDQLLSGEFVTSLLGSFINRCAFLSVRDYIESDVSTLARKVKLLYAEFLGDDLKSQYILGSPSEERELNPYLVKTFAYIAGKNEMSINIKKTMSRTLSGDFLRNRTFCGVFLPGAITQFVGTEKGREDEQVIELMDGWVSIVQLNVHRGWNPVKATWYVYQMWNLLRSVKVFSLSEDIRYYLPFALIWTPRSMGGIGFVHNGFLMASKDAYIYHLMKQDPAFDRLVRRASYLVKQSKQAPLTDALLSAIERDDVEPRETFSAGRRFVHESLDSKILQSMPVIRQRMKEAGLPPVGRNAYDKVDIGLIEKAVKGTSMFKTLTTRDFVLRMTKTYEAALRGEDGLASLPAAVQPLEDLIFELGTHLRPWHDAPLPTNPFSMNRGHLDNVTRWYGLDVGENSQFRLLDTLSRTLRKSATIRRDIPAETVIDILGHPAYFGNIENTALFFLSLGASEAEAVTIATDFMNSSGNYAIFQSLKGTSFNDGMLPMIDFSSGNVDRIVRVPAMPESVTKALKTYGMCISLIHFARTGEAREVTVHVPEGTESKLIHSLFGTDLPVKDYLPSFLNANSTSMYLGRYL